VDFAAKVLNGKKQIDIRESNKSAVIDMMLQQECNLAQLEEKLNLSHTALNKVIKELMEKKVVKLVGRRVQEVGRPSAFYNINPDCGAAAAVSFTSNYLEIFIVDMRGFEINRYCADYEYKDADTLLKLIVSTLSQLSQHYRIKSQLLMLSISVPASGLNEYTFEQWSQVFYDYFKDSQIVRGDIVVRRDIEFACIAERKFGVFKNGAENAVFLNLSGKMPMSIMFASESYYTASKSFNGNINALTHQDYRLLLQRHTGKHLSAASMEYTENSPSAVAAVHSFFEPVVDKVANLMFMLNIDKLIVFGDIKLFGSNLLAYFQDICRKKCSDATVLISRITDRSLPCAGAIWHSTYNSLKDIIVR